MPFIDRSPLEYQINSTTSIRRWEDTRAPTIADYKQFKVGDEWWHSTSQDWWKLCYRNATQGIWRLMAGTAAAAESFLPDAGTSPVVPNAANEITIVGGNGIITTGGLNQWDTSMQSPFEGSFIFENNTAATLEYVAIENNDTDPGSYSALALTSQDTGGDAFVLFTVDPAIMYMSLGIDNSDGDRFKLVNNTTTSGGNVIFMVDTALDSFWHYSGQVFQSNAWAGGTVFTRIQNTDNTNLNSNACLEILPGGAGGGDPYVQWQVGAVAQQYSLGIDNSVVDDPLRLTDGDSPSLGVTWALLDTVASNWSFPCHLIDQVIANAGGGVRNIISNTDATNVASDAFVSVETDPAGGDPHVHFLVGAVTTEFSLGIDNSDSDLLKLTTGASPSAGVELIAISGTEWVSAFNNFNNQVVNIADRVVIRAANLDNTDPASHAKVESRVEGASGGDPYLRVNVNGIQVYNIGIDNSDSDKLKITTNNDDVSTGTVAWEMTSAGERTMPLQPAFCAAQNGPALNVTGNGTNYTYIYGTEIYDINADYNPATYTFTAPVTGKYHFNADFILGGLAGGTYLIQQFISSNRTYNGDLLGPAACQETLGNTIRFSQSQLIDMDAADTCYVVVTGNGQGADNMDVPADANTFFTGFLAC